MHMLRFFIAVSLSFAALSVHAVDANGNTLGSSWLSIDLGDGFISQVPAPATHELLDQVRELRSELLTRKSELDELVKESEFDAKDVFITIIMPGGLVYAAFRKLSHHRAETQLASVTSEVDQLGKDISMLKSASRVSTVAMGIPIGGALGGG